jgi:hypothetical protein
MEIGDWWAQQMAAGKTAIEAAREFGVDIDQLRLMRSRTPTERLLLMEAMARLVFEARDSIRRQKEQLRRDREARLHRPAATSS